MRTSQIGSWYAVSVAFPNLTKTCIQLPYSFGLLLLGAYTQKTPAAGMEAQASIDATECRKVLTRPDTEPGLEHARTIHL